MPAAEQYTDPHAEHGEGPVWSPHWDGLAWVDLMAGDILRLDGVGGVQRWSVGKVAAAFRPRRAGGAVIATEHEFVLADAFGGPTRPVARALRDPGLRFNDGGCDPAGSFWCGSMAYDEAPGRGELFRLTPDGAVRRVLADVTISNGLAWTPDGTRAYYNDTPTGRIDLFDVDAAGELADRRPFVRIEPTDGAPDGLTLDADGRVWVALWGGAAVRCYGTDGSWSSRSAAGAQGDGLHVRRAGAGRAVHHHLAARGRGRAPFRRCRLPLPPRRPGCPALVRRLTGPGPRAPVEVERRQRRCRHCATNTGAALNSRCARRSVGHELGQAAL